MNREEASFILANIDRRVCDDELNEALDMAIKALDQEPCEDAISRQAVCKIIDDIRDCVSVNGYWAFLERLKKLPSVNPTKTGHWIDRSEGGRIKYPWMESNECSKCGENGSAAWNYCPNCGAKMIEPQESEKVRKYESTRTLY